MAREEKAKEFIRVWQEAKDIAEVSQKLKLTNSGAKEKAAYYRRHGVKLKKMGGKSYDWIALAEYAKTIRNGK